MTNPERQVAVVTDSGCSLRPEDKQVEELGVTILPLHLTFYEGQRVVAVKDLDIPVEEFYRRMKASTRLPQTSGAIPGLAQQAYLELSQKTKKIISVHITSRHSVVWESAVSGAKMAQEENPELAIEVIDSKSLSLGTWFLAQKAAVMAQQGAGLEEIKEAVLDTIPQIGLLVVLSSLENIIKGGRVPALRGYLGMLLKINLILEIKDGQLQEAGKAHGIIKARKEMISRVQDVPGIVRMAVLHAHCPKLAQEVQQAIGEFYLGDLPIYEAGPVLGVHAGEGAVGVAFERA